MGMFDSLYDQHGREWQTKAFACDLDAYRIGDTLPAPPGTYQVEVLGSESTGYRTTYATVRDGVLASVPDERDDRLGLMEYHGYYWPPRAESEATR